MRDSKVIIKIPEKAKRELLILLNIKKPDFPYNVDGFLYIISKIVNMPIYNRKYERLKKVPLYSKILRKELGKHYKRYLEYLMDHKFIDTDNHYIVSSHDQEGKCKCYGLKPSYLKSKLIHHTITKKSILSKIIQWREEYLGKNLDDKLLSKLYDMLKKFDIDINGAKAYLESMVAKGELSEQKKRIELEKCERINSKEECDLSLFITKDNFNRVHTNITNISKHIRENFLHINGKKVVGIDIVSSQATFLHSMLVNYIDELEDHSKKSISELLDMNDYHEKRTDVRDKYVNSRNSYSGPNIYDGNLNDSVPQIPNETIDSIIAKSRIELRNYGNILQAEGMYEFFQTKWDLIHQEDRSRDEIKKEWITYVFGRGKNKITMDMHLVWEHAFPMLTKLLNHLKDGDYKALSHSLQRTEADMMFNKICPRIDEEFKIPYCTVHDSVIVEEEYVDDVAYLFDEVFEECGVLTTVSY